jgi:excisionase family DNA binding protein
MGSVALVVPLLILVFLLYVVFRSFRDIHNQLERTFGQALLGEEYISASEAAQLLGVHQSTVLRWLRRMELPGLKIGRRWHIRRAELDNLVETDDSEGEEPIDVAEETGSDKGTAI